MSSEGDRDKPLLFQDGIEADPEAPPKEFLSHWMWGQLE